MKKRSKFFLAVEYIVLVITIIYFANRLLFAISYDKVPYSSFERMAKIGMINSVKVGKDKIFMELEGYKSNIIIKKVVYTDRIPGDNGDIILRLKEMGIQNIDGESSNDDFLNIALTWILPTLLFGALGNFIINSIDKKMNGESLEFGKVHAKIYAQKDLAVRFKDVAGQEDAKESLIEIVDFLNNPDKYKDIGAKIPKGALLVGPPGTGKTLMARAVAGEAGVPFFSIPGSEFVQMFVGLGAAKVRDLFKEAQSKAPCIVFIDEIDAIGKKRGVESGEGNDEREQTLNQLLTEMDGFGSANGVVIIGATNRVEVLDRALLRAGRFDRRIIMDAPDYKGRVGILQVHCRNKKMGRDVNLKKIARMTSGAVGADLANMMNEAALGALRNGRGEIEQIDLEEAVEDVLRGKIRKEKILDLKERRTIAFHESGHALASVLSEKPELFHKISIIPRANGNLGFTVKMPYNEKNVLTYDELMDKILILLSGRAAEEVMIGEISTAAKNDIQKATEIARSMVTRYGMSEKFDMTSLERENGEYLHSKFTKLMSERMEYEVDMEVLEIIKENHEKAMELMKKNKKVLEMSVEKLIEQESLSGDEFLRILKQL